MNIHLFLAAFNFLIFTGIQINIFIVHLTPFKWSISALESHVNFIVNTIFCCITLNSFKSIMSLNALLKEKLYPQNAVLQVGTVYFANYVNIIIPKGITGCFCLYVCLLLSVLQCVFVLPH